MVSVKKLRKAHKLNRQDFADILGVGFYTVRNWERNRCQPKGAALTLLILINQKPELIKTLKEALHENVYRL